MTQTEQTSTSREIFGRGSLYTLGSAGPMLAALLVTPMLVGLLDVPQYDAYAFNLMIMNVGINLLALGLPQVVTRNYLIDADGPRQARGLALMGAATALLIGLAGAATMALLGGSGLIWQVGVAAGLGGGLAVGQALSIARRSVGIFLILALGQSFGAPLLGLASVWLVGRSAANYFTGIAIGYGLLVVFLLVWVRRLGPAALSIRGFAGALRISLPIVPHQLAVGSVSALAVFIAAAVAGSGAPSIIQIGTLVGTAPLIIISSLSYAWLPAMLTLPEEQRPAGITSSSRRVAWLAALGSGSLALLAPWLLGFLNQGGKHDLGAMVPVAAIVAFSACLAAPYQAHMQLILTSGRTQVLALLTPLAVGLGGVAGWLAAGWIGVVGVALGYPVTYALLWLAARWLAGRVSPTRWSDRVVLPALATCLVMVVAGATLTWSGPVGLTLRLGGAVGGLAAAMVLFVRTLRPGSEVKS